MNIFIVYWHPEPASFNAAMFRTASETLADAGYTVKTSDLNAMRFDPVSGRKNFLTVKDPAYFKQQVEELHATETNSFAPEIETEIAKLEWCDLMIWQFPLWWFGLPATLKGWVDRVFAKGRVYGPGFYYESGKFRGKKAMLSVTTGGGVQANQKGGLTDELAGVLRPIHRGIFQFVGFDVLAPQVVYGAAALTDEQRAQALADYSLRLREISRESPIEVGNF